MGFKTGLMRPVICPQLVKREPCVWYALVSSGPIGRVGLGEARDRHKAGAFRREPFAPVG